jgi:hypothetical protein
MRVASPSKVGMREVLIHMMSTAIGRLLAHNQQLQCLPVFTSSRLHTSSWRSSNQRHHRHSSLSPLLNHLQCPYHLPSMARKALSNSCVGECSGFPEYCPDLPLTSFAFGRWDWCRQEFTDQLSLRQHVMRSHVEQSVTVPKDSLHVWQSGNGVWRGREKEYSKY